jgi:hypothetical protein
MGIDTRAATPRAWNVPLDEWPVTTTPRSMKRPRRSGESQGQARGSRPSMRAQQIMRQRADVSLPQMDHSHQSELWRPLTFGSR